MTALIRTLQNALLERGVAQQVATESAMACSDGTLSMGVDKTLIAPQRLQEPLQTIQWTHPCVGDWLAQELSIHFTSFQSRHDGKGDRLRGARADADSHVGRNGADGVESLVEIDLFLAQPQRLQLVCLFKAPILRDDALLAMQLMPV